MVQEVLDAVCETFDSCETLAYADLSTRLVLATNSETDQRRDALNALCAQAEVVLEGGNISVIATASGFRLFLRDHSEPMDGLICLCGLQTDMAKFIPVAQQCLSEISNAVGEA